MMVPLTAGRVARRLPAPVALWWMLTGGDVSTWVVGVPVVCGAAAAGAALATSHGWRVSAGGLLAFVPYFAWRSLAGGADVAVRALLPSLPIAPSVERYPMRLPAEGPARVFFANTINLLPGTASVDLEADAVIVHLLRDPTQTRADLRTLEAKVAALFGLTLGPERRGDEAP